ncbi:hypothetical protein [Psychrobacillus sp. L4]|uniref:hypothetical protein n=1 Tax=Psychrobacillus sp. L4 TaxID=3236892 RepID=UPI0036F41765
MQKNVTLIVVIYILVYENDYMGIALKTSNLFNNLPLPHVKVDIVEMLDTC